MSTAGHTPNFVAEAAIYPFRCVKVGTASFNAVQSTANPEILLGVTDGSVSQFDRSVHAQVGEVVSLQNGEFVQMTAGGTIVVGDTLIATTDGKVVADTAATEYIAQACEPASDGEVFWAKKIGAWTISGGGPSPIGGGWPAPESKALWSCEFTGSLPILLDQPVNGDLSIWGGGPDFYFQSLSNAGAAVEQNFFPIANHFGVVDVSLIQFDITANWITVGNAPPYSPGNWTGSSVGGRPGVDIRYNNNEFVVIWKPLSFMTIPDNSIAWKAWAGCATSSISYPDDPGEPAVGFFFRASNAGANWVCVARLINTSTLAAVEYTQSSGVPVDVITPDWMNMKIVTVEGVAPGSYPTIEYYIDSVLVHSFDLNTVASNIRSSVDQAPIFAMMGGLVGPYEDGPRYLVSQLDYMHSLTTFTNPR